MLAVFMPVAVGVIFRFLGVGAEAVAALLMVGTIAGILMATFLNNSGGAWDNAKKFIEMGQYGGKGSETHKAAVVGDTVGDPFKDTSSVALNPIIKFTTLFGLLAVSLAVDLTRKQGANFTTTLSAIFFLISVFFVYRSFYGMRIESGEGK
jgi:K(+)-stimulated pyrophosphate-energized sodium pump